MGFPQVPEYADHLTFNQQGQLIVGFNYVDCNTHLDSLLFTNQSCGFPAIGLAWSSPLSTVGFSRSSMSEEYFSVYPNPCQAFIQLSTEYRDDGWQVQFFNQQGKEMVLPSLSQQKYDTRSLAPGLYWVRISAFSGSVSHTCFFQKQL